DAYASGGSIGYDHKKMGITARGAWESVKRHFREIDKDIQKEDFSVVGVGDMSGDVFGNGMLLSKHIKLLGAFNHLQIFVDPDPDPAKSFAERKRMFNLARSSWSDYNTDLISKGGGIFERSAKSITLTPQIKKCFGISKSQLTPNELIKIILTAKVELLWFGGIGTYIKASTEVDADAGDRANDPVRINANQLNCQVIGEGANLGVTQRARIEFGLLKGRLNTDSVDNSAGVDCSDHEVNIKILLNSVVAKGKLTQAQRNKLLAKMTGEVGDLVLRDNYLQTQAITLVEAQDIELLDHQTRFMRFLEREGRLDRAIEFLPDEETLIDREKGSIGLTRPEISIIIPYAKLWLYDMILDSDLPDDANLRQDLIDYFPTPLRAKYRNDIFQHRLKREIIATVVTNSMINRVGGTFVTNMMEKSGAEPIDIARAYIATRDAFGLEDIWAEIETLDNKVDAAMQVTLLKDVNKLIERSTLWFLRNARKPIDIGANIKEFSSATKMLAGKIERVAPESATSRVNFRVNRYARLGVPQDLARRVAYLILLVSSLDIVRTSASCKMGVEDTAGIYFEIGESFGLGWLRYNAEKLPGDNYWQKLASAAVIEELYGHQKGITAMIMSSAANGSNPLVQWSKINSATMDQTKQMLNELKSAEQVDLSMLAVVSRHLGSIIGTTD
ncbi:MAG: NAD-glutamate dehydrogenase, partial [Rhodospirillales bacterium]|nr:NAD-glutamate dehydrogenase [Rhodospirillales bacterium]